MTAHRPSRNEPETRLEDDEHDPQRGEGEANPHRSAEIVPLFERLQEHEAEMTVTGGAGINRLLDNRLQAAIGTQLRILYRGLIDEPLPPRFLALLDDLEAEPR